MSKRLFCISGSYRPNGATEQALTIAADEARRLGWECHRVRLIEKNIRFCTNCRSCTQHEGSGRGECVLQDDVAEILAEVDQSDALILASPTNFFDVTAITRTFLERQVPVAYWPWNKPAPVDRNKRMQRPAVLITSTAMPAIFARFFTRSMKSLRDMAKCLRAKPVDRLFIGLAALPPGSELPASAKRRVQRAVAQLIRASPMH